MGPYPIWAKEEEIIIHTHTEMYVHRRYNHRKRQLEGGHMQTKENGIKKNRTCQHIDLGLPASRTVRK